MATLVTAAIAIWWLAIVAQHLPDRPVVENGSVVLDEFQRAKDILIVVLPLFSASLAYWVGHRETSKAQDDAKMAREQLTAVVGEGGKDIFESARHRYPEAFKK